MKWWQESQCKALASEHARMNSKYHRSDLGSVWLFTVYMALAEKIRQCFQISRAKSPDMSLSLEELGKELSGCFTATTRRRTIVTPIYLAWNFHSSVAGHNPNYFQQSEFSRISNVVISNLFLFLGSCRSVPKEAHYIAQCLSSVGVLTRASRRWTLLLVDHMDK